VWRHTCLRRAHSRGIDRIPSWSREQQRQAGQHHRQRELHAVRQEVAVRQVDDHSRDRHRAGEQECGQACGGAREECETAANFDDHQNRGVERREWQPGRLQKSRQSREAEHEDLLQPVRQEDRPDRHAQNEQTAVQRLFAVHHIHPFLV
jgi:hypothetical protein